MGIGRRRRARRRIAQHARKHLDDVVFLAARHERLRLAKFARQIVAVSRRHAACHDELRGPFDEIRQVAYLENSLEALFGCGLNERARVHDHDIGRGRVIAYLIAGRGQSFRHFGGVNFVFGAAKRHETHARRALSQNIHVNVRHAYTLLRYR